MPGAVVEITGITGSDIVSVDVVAIEPEFSQFLEVIGRVFEIAVLVDVELVIAAVHQAPPSDGKIG